MDDSENERQMRATQEIGVLIFGVSATWEPVINIGTRFMRVLFLVCDFDNIVIMSSIPELDSTDSDTMETGLAVTKTKYP